jgi:hypothetical protein
MRWETRGYYAGGHMKYTQHFNLNGPYGDLDGEAMIVLKQISKKEGENWTYVVHYGDKWRAPVNTVLDFEVT